ncbi:MAG: hypothetical protein AXW17_07090 [Colwellia sp. Phe_37]|nr:MAG: hypothetical protein AXW17_07090 [Colwellia sp. Phe_37]
MKIGVVVTGNRENGGVYQYSQSLLEGLILDNTNEYVVFTNDDDVRFDRCGMLVRKLSCRSGIFWDLMRFFQVVFMLRKLVFLNKSEKIFFSDIDFLIYPSMSIRSHLIMNKPFIYTLHDLQEKYYPGFFSYSERLVRYFVNLNVSKMAAHIICESNYVKNDIKRFLGACDEKISVIPAPPCSEYLNIKLRDKRRDEVRNKYALPSNYIFYPAQFWKHKNHLKLLEAFKILSVECEDVMLVLTGSKKAAYKEVMNCIEYLGLGGRVQVLGYVDSSDLPYVYEGANVLAMPTLFESISIPVYEAFAMRVPVVCSDVVALPEQVNGAGLLFNPDDPNDIYMKIKAMLDSKSLREGFVNKGFNIITSFKIEKYRDELMATFKKGGASD